MDILARGKYVITDANDGEKGVFTDGAVYFSEGKVKEVGDFAALKDKYPHAIIKGNGKQLLMPGLIDGHSHGWGLSAIQRGLTYDFLENVLINWAYMLNIDPELNAMMSAIRHLRSGCTTMHHIIGFLGQKRLYRVGSSYATMHHNNWGEAPNMLELGVKAIENYKKVGIRVAFSPGVLNMNTLALDDTEFFATLPPDLQEFARPMVYYDKKAVEDDFFNTFEELYSRYNGEETRVLLSPTWVQGCDDGFLQHIKERADNLGKIQIHIHTLQTPIQKAYGLKKYGKSLLAHLDDIGLVDENLTLGHGVYLSEADIELLATKRASITHHPSCNLAVRNGISPVYYLYKAGVNVALGMDDKTINDDEDAIMELRMIHKLHRMSGYDLANTSALNALDILKMGTTNAARVCGFDREIGALKKGMKADAILVDLEEIMEDPWTSTDLSIAEIFIHRAKGAHVNTVIVGGEVVMEDRKFLTVDVDLIYNEVRKQAQKGISLEQRKFADELQRIKPYYHKWYKGWVEDNIEWEPFYLLNSRK
jgi:cytosine/adenosine deaminase-related metal-dependent hydrolase